MEIGKTKMANFNEKANSGIGYIMNSQEFFIYRTGTIKEFARTIHDELYLLTNTYRLFIQYKTTHRVKRMAGRCFLWDNSHGDHMKDPGNGIELRSLNDASQDDCEGFCNPRFDGVSAAILITNRYVFMYGDVQIEVDNITQDKKHVICTVSLCEYIVSFFKIPAETFDRHFGLKENFSMQCEKVFGEAEDAKPVRVETLENDKIYDAYEIACLMDSNRLCSDLLSSLLRLNSVINSHKDVYDKSQVARKAVEDLAIELGISIRNIEDGLK